MCPEVGCSFSARPIFQTHTPKSSHADPFVRSITGRSSGRAELLTGGGVSLPRPCGGVRRAA
jgi:hypothetical protein